jgi:DNA-3-methyladenine glycosylase II
MTYAGIPERHLCSRDAVLERLICDQPVRWSPQRTEDELSGLVRIVISQQISTSAARTITQRVERAFPNMKIGQLNGLSFEILRSCGLSPRKANCCLAIADASNNLRTDLSQVPPRYERILLIPGIGRWTLDILRIMILKEIDIIPYGDLGLGRAIYRNYSGPPSLSELAKVWSPYSSVACWYLWRSLGNPPLG